MSFDCIAAARRFDFAAHLPFHVAGRQVGWIRTRDVPHLLRWPDLFAERGGAIVLDARLDTPEMRSEAMSEPLRILAREGVITGWRDETYAIRNRFDDVPLAFIERAAARFLGTQTYAVHLNGIVEYAAATPRQFWIGRRSLSKATDPGMRDNVVAGGIAWGHSVEDTILKECWEEAGIPADIAGRAMPGRCVNLLCSLPEGTQAEQIFIYDLPLPADFVPENQDGEVAAHALASVEQVLAWLHAGELTLDASLATIDGLLRHRLLDAAEAPGMAALFEPHAWLAR
jgi:8-oxo-dGTP pyrophosphatase MutT (NUDIX family)